MGLTILAIIKMNIEDPRDEFTGPNQSDFAYRNNPEQFELDEKKYDELVDRYEDAQIKATIDRFNIGYIGFGNLRRELVQLIEFGYFTGNSIGEDYTLNYKDIEDAQDLKDFFLHSDCDGELGTEQIEVLNKHMQQHSDAILNSGEPRIIKFADFVQKSVEEQADWRFL